VLTTGVYCRPSCPARKARRENVLFFSTREDARRKGFRPCRRCRPDEDGDAIRTAAIEKACRAIEKSRGSVSLAELARAAGMGRFHFHRLFKEVTGVTPKAYSNAVRRKTVREKLPAEASVTDAVYRSGFGSSSRFYESSGKMLGMKPREFRSGGKGVGLRFAVGQCSLGAILVAASEKGVAAIMLGDDPEALVRELECSFPKAELSGGDPDFERLVATVIGFVEDPSRGLGLPLDIRGTAFQERVWRALMEIPAGETATYSRIAAKIGAPGSARAVGSACASNLLAVAIPCHRVVRTDGSLSGYRWGIERKRSLLRRESE
jgi:AraC family transcriptional regulator of adaptative response/methylated-DNA-[protein]-cysteine methyltransferase